MARTRLVWLVNRTITPLDVIFDGAPEVIPAGYKTVTVVDKDKKGNELLTKDGDPKMVAKVVGVGGGADRDDPKHREMYLAAGDPYAHQVEYGAAEAYIRQHPIMGTQDPLSVDARDTQYLLACVAWGGEIDHIEQSDAIELIDRSLLPDDRQNIDVRGVAGKRRDVSRGVLTDRKQQANKRRAALDAGENPMGIKISA